MNASLHVLLIEDNPTDVLLTEEALSTNRFHVQNSQRLGDALKLLLAKQFDVILLDLGLPDSQGLDTLRTLRGKNPQVAVVVLTGKNDEALALQSLKEGAQDYLVKGELQASLLQRAIRYAVERSASESMLRQSEQRFHEVTEHIDQVLWMIDAKESKILYVSQGYEKMWGRSRQSLIDNPRSYMEGIHPLDREVMQREDAAMYQTGKIDAEYRVLRPDGSVRWIWIRGYPVMEEGQIVRLVGVIEDITEKRRVAAERDALLSRLQLHIQRMPLVYILFDADFRITDWNPAAERTLGYTREEALGKQPNDLNPPSFRHEATKIMERIRAGDMVAHSINENLTKDGRKIICEWFNTPLMTEDGRFTGLLCLGRDVTGQKALQADQARLAAIVKASEEQMRLLLESTGEGIYGIDMQGHCTFINRAAAAILGHTQDEIIGRDMHELIHHHRTDGSPYPVEQCPIYRAMQNRSGVRVHDEVLWRKDGTSFAADYSSFPIMKGENIQGAVVTFQDITQAKQLEDQFRQAQKMEAIGSLAGGVAHDFNNLLTIINGYSEIIQMQIPADSPIRALAHEIGQAGDRAASLTRQLLAFSRKQVLEPKVLNLNTVVTDIAKMLNRLIGEDVDLNTVLEPGLGRVKADPGQIEQVLINLAVNARDAMPQGGKLTIETANAELDEMYTQAYSDLRPGPYVMLAVTDTGTGMDEATRNRVFEPFFTTKEPGKGTGLGLATVFGIVKQSEGHVAVYTELGRGTAFKVYLPRIEVMAGAGVSGSRQVAVAHGTETILLTEDEPALRALARHVLQMHGYTVLEASRGEKALRTAEEYKGTIHLLVTDVVMPAMSGRQLAERLTAARPGLKVLYLSGYTDDAVVRHGVLQAETAFLQKPFTPSALAQKVREVLDRPST